MNQLPDYLQNRQSRGLAQRVSQNLGTSSPPYLSIMDGKFTLIDSAGNEQPVLTFEGDPNKCLRGQFPGAYIDIVIIDVADHVSQEYYPPEDAFDRNAGSWKPPICFSHNGIGPSKLASEPQAPTCASCPNIAWGSATSKVTGKGVPACHQKYLVSFVYPGHDIAFLLRIPPNSLKNYRAYVEQFKGQNFTMEIVLTRLSFVSQGTLAFIPSGFALPPMLALSDKLYKVGTDAMVGRLDLPIQRALAAPTSVTIVNAGSGYHVEEGERVFTPAAAAVTMQPQTTAAPAAATVQPASPAASSGRGRRRNTAAAPAAPSPAVGGQTQAPFMEQQPTQPATPTPGSQPAPFGMSPGVPPNPEVEGMLNNLFGPA